MKKQSANNNQKTFYHILANTLISGVTNFTVWFGITFFTYLETKSVMATGIISGIFLVSTAISGFWFGSLVDHNKKKKIMTASTIASFVAYVVAFLIYTLSPDGSFKNPASLSLWALVLSCMAGVLAGNLRNITLPVVVTMLFDEAERDKANGLVGTTNGVSFLFTSVISGFLVGLAGMFYILIMGIVVMVLTLIHLNFLKLPEKEIFHADGQQPGVDVKGTYSVVSKIPGLLALIAFTTINNFLGGVFMALMDAYGLSLVSVQTWGILWGFLSTGFIIGGLYISKKGLGKNPVYSMIMANLIIWVICIFFTIQPWIWLLVAGMYVYLCVVPFIEASEHTILQKVVPPQRQGRVFGFAQSIEQMASPLTAFLIGPLTQFIFIPFMTTGKGVDLIGGWFGTGEDRGIALVFTLTGIIGLLVTLLAKDTNYYKELSAKYLSK